MTLLLIYLFLALFVSFLCSLLESVILSITPSHINLLIKEKKRGGKTLKTLKEKIDRPLSAVLTLNTIANTMGAAGVGAQVLKLYGSSWVAIASGLLTFGILVFSEIIPKNLGAAYWKKLALPCALIIKYLIYFTYPFVILFELIAASIIPKHKRKETMSREEMIVAAETGLEEGVLVDKESRIIKNLLGLNIILVKDVMTPRSVMFALQKDSTVYDVLNKYSIKIFSRIPVYGENIDDIIGKVLRFKIINASSEDEEHTKIGDLIKPVHSVNENLSVANVLDEFIKKQEHLFMVTNELGDIAGLITLEDAIETLLGVEIVDEFDSVEDMRKYALEQWERRQQTKDSHYLSKINKEIDDDSVT
ncbi:MAG: hemolysin family protein [bacterium]|nr:hemolysin family protein [bacterium]MBU1917984.1 hemolysin family protein [bacterium]